MGDQQQQQHKYPPPFSLSFDKNNTVRILRTLHIRIRGRYSLTNVGVGIPDGLGGLPDIPGQVIEVRPQEGKYEVRDPLEDNEDLMERINVVFERIGSQQAKPVKRYGGKLNDDEMVTLCWELYQAKAAGAVNEIEGRVPTERELKMMPGRRLYDPGNSSTFKPRYVDQVPDWINRIEPVSV